MDALVWNRSDLQREFPGESNILGALNRIEQHLAESGYVVCEVFIDGRRVAEEDEAHLSYQLVEEVADFKVSYQPLNTLLSRSLMSVTDMIPKIIEGSTKAANLIHVGDHQEASLLIVKIMESCYWLTQTLTQLKALLQIQPGGDQLEEWDLAEKGLHQVVKAMLSGLEAEDFIVVADNLQSVLPKTLDQWFFLIKDLEGDGQMITSN